MYTGALGRVKPVFAQGHTPVGAVTQPQQRAARALPPPLLLLPPHSRLAAVTATEEV